MRGLSLRLIMLPCRLGAQTEGRARTEAGGGGVETGEHRALVKEGRGGWAVPFLCCQLGGHAAGRSHHWLPRIITRMNLTQTHRHTQARYSQRRTTPWQIEKDSSDCCLLRRHIRQERC